MAIYKRGREFELGTTEHKSSKWPERDSNPGRPDCESDALTTRPRCLHEFEIPEFEIHKTFYFGPNLIRSVKRLTEEICD